MSTPVAPSTLTVAAPHGTSGAQTTTFTPSRPRSAKDVMPAGLSGGTAISRVLLAKSWGSSAGRPSATALSMLAVSAEAKTSAGAPCWICATRSEDAPKLKLTFTPLRDASNFLPSSVNVEVNEDPANTVSVLSVAPEEPLEESPEDAEPSEDPDPHAATAASS